MGRKQQPTTVEARIAAEVVEKEWIVRTAVKSGNKTRLDPSLSGSDTDTF